MSLFCEFCDELSAYTYRIGSLRVGLCRYHLVMLYLALPLDWTD